MSERRKWKTVRFSPILWNGAGWPGAPEIGARGFLLLLLLAVFPHQAAGGEELKYHLSETCSFLIADGGGWNPLAGHYVNYTLVAYNKSCESPPCVKELACKVGSCPGCVYYGGPADFLLTLAVESSTARAVFDVSCVVGNGSSGGRFPVSCVVAKAGFGYPVMEKYFVLKNTGGEKWGFDKEVIEVRRPVEEAFRALSDAAAGPPVASSCSVTWNSGNVVVAGNPAKLTARMIDANGNAAAVNPSTQTYGGYLYFSFADVSGKMVSGPNVSLIPVSSPGYQSFTFNWTKAGNFILNMNVSGAAIAGSPFGFFANPGPLHYPSCSGVWTDGVSDFSIDTEAILRVTLVDAFGNPVILPHGLERLTIYNNLAVSYKGVTDYTNTSFLQTTETDSSNVELVTFNTQLAGNLTLQVGSSAVPTDFISNSPFHLTVSAGPVSVANSMGFWYPNNVPVVQVGEPAKYVFRQRDKYWNPVCPATGSQEIKTMYAIVPQLLSLNVSSQANQTAGETMYWFTLFVAGNYSFRLQDAVGSIVPGLPQSLMVVPGQISVRNCSANLVHTNYSFQNGVPLFYAGSTVQVKIHLLDQYGNEVSARAGVPGAFVDLNVTLTGAPSGVVRSLTNQPPDGSGYQTITFVCLKAGPTVYQLNIGQGNQTVLNSPVWFMIGPGPLSPRNSTGSWQLGDLQSGKVGQPLTLRVYTMDCCGNNFSLATGFAHGYSIRLQTDYNRDVTSSGVDGKMKVVTGVGFDDITFIPTFAGPVSVSVYQTAYRVFLQNSPLSIPVQSGAVVLSKSYALFDPEAWFYAGETVVLQLLQLDKYGNVVGLGTYSTEKVLFNGTVYGGGVGGKYFPMPDVQVSVTGPVDRVYNATWVLTTASDRYKVEITAMYLDPITSTARYILLDVFGGGPITFSIAPAEVNVSLSVVRSGSGFGDVVPISCPGKTVYAGFQDAIWIELRDMYSNSIRSVPGISTMDMYGFSTFNLTLHNGSTDVTSLAIAGGVINVPSPDGSSLQAIQFLPMLAGQFDVHVTSGSSNETPICGRMTLKSMAGSLSVPHCVGSWQSGVNTVGAGFRISMTVLMRDEYNNSFTADFTNPARTNKAFRFNMINVVGLQNVIIHVLQSDMDNDGISTLTFVPTVAGKWQLQVGNRGSNHNTNGQIIGSPFNFTVTAGNASLANCVGSWVGGLPTFHAGTPITFQVLMKDSLGNTLSSSNGISDFLNLTMSVMARTGSMLTIPLYNTTITKDHDVGYQYLTFQMQMMGQFLLQVGFGSQYISGSPFPFAISVGFPVVARCTGAWFNQMNSFEAGYSTAILNVQLVDAFGNAVTKANGGNPLFIFTLTVVGHSNTSAVIANVTQIGGQSIQFIPIMVGSFQLRVGSKDTIIGSPFSFTVVAGPLSVPSCIGSWVKNENSFISGQQANVSVLLMDAVGNNISMSTGRTETYTFSVDVDVTSPNTIHDLQVSSAQASMGYVYISFTTFLAAQAMKLRVGTMYQGSWKQQIHNSPLTFSVAPGPFQASACNGAWRSGINEYQRPSLAQFLVTQRDAAGNPIYTKAGNSFHSLQASLSALNTGASVAMANVSWSLFPGQASTCVQLLTFTPTKDGSFLLNIFDQTGAILGGPFLVVYFSGNVVPSMSTLMGPGLNNSTAGVHSSFMIQLNDAYGNPAQEVKQLSTVGGLTAVLHMQNTTYEVPVTIAKDPVLGGGSLYSASYTATVAGIYDILVYYAGTLLMKGLSKTVFPGAVDAMTCSAQGPALQGTQKAGTSLTFQVYIYDSRSNSVPKSNVQILILPTDGTKLTNITVDADGVTSVTLAITKAPQAYFIYVLVSANAYANNADYVDQTGSPSLMDTSGVPQNISGSPFWINVQAGLPNASLSNASGNGLNAHASLNQWNSIIVTLLDSYGNAASGYVSMLAFNITGVGDAESSIFQDEGNGQYISQFKPLSLGSYQISVSLQGVGLNGSPWNTTVVGSPLPSAGNDTATTLDGIPVAINVTANDQVFIGTVKVVAVSMAPLKGYATITNNQVLYTPNYDFYGADRLAYTIEDGYNRTATAYVMLKITLRPPHIVSMPSVIAGLEDFPLPTFGGIAGMSIDYGRPMDTIFAVFNADHGNLYVSSPAVSNNLGFGGAQAALNSSIQNVHYVGYLNFNGNDTIALRVFDRWGNGDSRSMTVIVQPVNDPPTLMAPSIMEIHSLWVNFGGAFIPGIVVGDPDDADVQGDQSVLMLVVSLQLDGGLLKLSIPYTYRRDVFLMDKPSSGWQQRPKDPNDGDYVHVQGLGIQFTAPVLVCNNILRQLMFAKHDLNFSVNQVMLLVLVNDMGNWGCDLNNCTTNQSIPLSVSKFIEVELLDWLTVLENLWFHTLVATRNILGASGGTVSVLSILVILLMMHLCRKARAKHRAARYSDADELNEELLCEQSRVFNPMWIPSAAGDLDLCISSTPNPVFLELRKTEFRRRLNKVKEEVEREILGVLKKPSEFVNKNSNVSELQEKPNKPKNPS